MENLNLFVTNHIGTIVIVMGFFTIFLLGLILGMRSSLKALQKKYDFFTQGKDVNIDTVLTETLSELEMTKKELAELTVKHNKLREQVRGCLQVVKLERYDAFDAMGGEMSYSILLADENKDGVILTSIYGRDESRCYAKDLKNGKSKYVLAEEEKNLL